MRIYIAGPISIGDQFANVGRGVTAYLDLLELGHHPYLPHMSALAHMVRPQAYETWMELDMVWLGQCHGLLRLDGESKGADREAARAFELGLPVWHRIEDILGNQGPDDDRAEDEKAASDLRGAIDPEQTAAMIAKLSVEMVRLKASILEVTRERTRQMEDLDGRIMSLEAPGDKTSAETKRGWTADDRDASREAIKAIRLADEIAKLEGYIGDNA